MAHTRTWNAAYEAIPPNTQAASQGAERIRDLKTDVEERFTLDHVMDETDDDGYHKQITLEEQASAPGNLANKFRIYGLVVNSLTEIHFLTEDGTQWQITDNGKLFLLATHNAWTKGQAITEVEITYASTIAPDATLSNAFWVDLTGNVILDNPTGGKSGQVLTIMFKQDATGGRTLTAGATLYGNTSDDLVLSTAASAIDMLTMYYDGDASRWRVMHLKKDIDNAL